MAAHRNLSQPNFVFGDMVPIAIIDWDSTRPGTRVDNLGDFLWAFVHPALYGDGEPAARMLAAAVDAYGPRDAGPKRCWSTSDGSCWTTLTRGNGV